MSKPCTFAHTQLEWRGEKTFTEVLPYTRSTQIASKKMRREKNDKQFRVFMLRFQLKATRKFIKLLFCLYVA